MQSLDDLENRFYDDIGRIVSDFIKIYELQHKEEIAELSDPLLRWLDFVLRYIPSRPREIVFSNRFPKILNADAQSSLESFQRIIEAGGNLNPYQSKGLTLHNDTSAAKRQQRTDLLWADWGIHHFHLTAAPIPAGSYFSNRSSWLLFCLVGEEFVGLIDIRDHGESNLFSDPKLITTVVESWPEIMERYRLKDLSASRAPLTTTDLANLRKGGVSSFATINNQMYIGPGMGVTSASTPTRVTMAMMKVRRYVRELAKVVHDPTSEFRKETAAAGISDPQYGITLTRNALAVHEEKENKAFLFPRAVSIERKSFLAELHDLVAPAWAIKFTVDRALHS